MVIFSFGVYYYCNILGRRGQAWHIWASLQWVELLLSFNACSTNHADSIALLLSQIIVSLFLFPAISRKPIRKMIRISKRGCMNKLKFKMAHLCAYLFLSSSLGFIEVLKSSPLPQCFREDIKTHWVKIWKVWQQESIKKSPGFDMFSLGRLKLFCEKRLDWIILVKFLFDTFLCTIFYSKSSFSSTKRNGAICWRKRFDLSNGQD